MITFAERRINGEVTIGQRYMTPGGRVYSGNAYCERGVTEDTLVLLNGIRRDFRVVAGNRNIA